MERGIFFCVLLAFVSHLAHCQIDCNDIFFKNNPALLSEVDGTLFAIGLDNVNPDNEIINCVSKGDIVSIRTTKDYGIDYTVNVSTTAIEETTRDSYFPYVVVKTNHNWTQQLNEDARLKIMDAYTEKGIKCFATWTSRRSRQGVRVYCSKQKISDAKIRKWIAGQFAKYNTY